LVSIGDAYATTNPIYGRGLTSVPRHAEILVDTLWDHPRIGSDFDTALAHRMFAATHPAWYDNVRHDDHRTRVWRATLGLTPLPGKPMHGLPLPLAISPPGGGRRVRPVTAGDAAARRTDPVSSTTVS
jgi:hypothetical protein